MTRALAVAPTSGSPGRPPAHQPALWSHKRVGFVLFGAATSASAGLIAPKYGLLVGGVALVGGWLATLDTWRRLYALTLVLTVCGASSQPILASIAYYPRYVVAASLAAWTWHRARNEIGPLRATRLSRWLTDGIWALVFVACASVVWSYTRTTTAQQVVAFVILAALLSTLARQRWVTDSTRIVGDLSVAYVVLIGSFVASLLLGPAGFSNANVYGGRLEGIYSNPNTLGDLIGLAVPLGVGLFISTKRWSYLVWLVPTAIALAQCQTRTAVVAATVGIAWLVVRRGMTMTIKVGLAAIVVAYAGYAASRVLGIALPRAATRIIARFTNSGPGGALNSRTVAWHDAISLWEHHPIQGYGFQAGDALFAKLFDNGVITFGAAPTHNSYLQALLELGVLGAIPLLVVHFGAILPASLRASRSHPGSPFVGVVVAGIAIALTESAMFGTGQPYPWIFWLAVAAITCATPDRVDQLPVELSPGLTTTERRLLRARGPFED